MYKGLYVDDDYNKLQLLNELLADKVKLELHSDPRLALLDLRNHTYDFIVVDVNMPIMNGFELLEIIDNERLNPQAKIFILTSLQDDEDKQKGFSFNIDDYLSFDMSFKEIELRIINALQRSTIPTTTIQYEGFVLDTEFNILSKDDKEIKMTPSEMRIIKSLFSKNGTVDNYDDFLDMVWPSVLIQRPTVNTHISYLNKKIAKVNIHVCRTSKGGFMVRNGAKHNL
jgi:two-component system phosphate regulon response regulator PhoB